MSGSLSSVRDPAKEPVRPRDTSGGMPPTTRGDYEDLVLDQSAAELEVQTGA